MSANLRMRMDPEVGSLSSLRWNNCFASRVSEAKSFCVVDLTSFADATAPVSGTLVRKRASRAGFSHLGRVRDGHETMLPRPHDLKHLHPTRALARGLLMGMSR